MTRANTAGSLQDLMDSVPDLVDYFANDCLSPHGRNQAGLSPVPLEFTNWREEQYGWREGLTLFDQSHHMPETFLSGPDARKLLSRVGVNSLEGFVPFKAKQFVAVNHKGRMIGECVLQCLEDGSFELISGMPVQDWVHYVAESEGYDVKIVRDHPTAENPNRTRFRFGTDGPNAEALFREIVEKDPGEIKFFNMAKVRIAGCDVLVLRHGMAGYKGVEYSGDFADGPKVLARLLEAGHKHGLKRGGTKAYYSTLGETGWIGYPVPAIYSDPEYEGFRRWLSGTSWQARFQLGGSFRARDISEYYVTPWDMNMGRVVKFDHDFIGREALEAIADGPHRRKMTLVWDNDDIIRIFASMLDEDELPYKAMDLPVSSYAMGHWDRVLSADDGRQVGMSAFIGYTATERKFLSPVILDPKFAVEGARVKVVWGEPGGGSRKPHVERHRQTEVWATVAANPYAKAAREYKNARLERKAG